ncbi:Subtilisin-like protease SBT5.4, partial [Glycine soja]
CQLALRFVVGVWSESKNFSDEGKLIGARYFYKGYEANAGTKLNASELSCWITKSSSCSVMNENTEHDATKLEAEAKEEEEHRRTKRFYPYLLLCYGGPRPRILGSFHAVANDITVVASGGNSGPSPGTVSNNEPWMLTVAASTIDRDFAGYVTLGDKKIIKGASLSEHHLPSNKMYPLATTVPSLFYGKPYTCPKSFSLADFNYPAITIPQLDPGHSLNVTRTVTNVGSPRTYRVHIKAPPQVVVTVEPRKLRFKKKGERKELRVTLTLKPQTKNTTDYVFGWLTWTDHKHHVRSPIAVKIAH